MLATDGRPDEWDFVDLMPRHDGNEHEGGQEKPHAIGTGRCARENEKRKHEPDSGTHGSEP